MLSNTSNIVITYRYFLFCFRFQQEETTHPKRRGMTEIEFKFTGCIVFPEAEGRAETTSDRTVVYIPLQITPSIIKAYGKHYWLVPRCVQSFTWLSWRSFMGFPILPIECWVNTLQHGSSFCLTWLLTVLTFVFISTLYNLGRCKGFLGK